MGNRHTNEIVSGSIVAQVRRSVCLEKTDGSTGTLIQVLKPVYSNVKVMATSGEMSAEKSHTLGHSLLSVG